MGRRFEVKGKPKAWVERDSSGKFKNWTSKSRSVPRDRATQSRNTVKAGYGHQGDQKKRIRNPFRKKQELKIFDLGGTPRYAIGIQKNKPLRTVMSLDHAKSVVSNFRRNFPFRLK